jgi:hypothetical protein
VAAILHSKKGLLWLFICLNAIFDCGHAGVTLPVSQPMINSITIVGTNLVFDATFPSGVDQSALELRSTLTAGWQVAAQIDVPTNGGNVEFQIAQPVLASAFFRLNTTMHAASQAEPSREIQYVAVPSLAKIATNAEPADEAVFHFKGQIDGSDRIVITHKGATWEHVNWGWPAGTVTVNDLEWNPSEMNFMTSTGAVEFLPKTYSLAAANLEVIEGRDVVALERTNGALIVYLDDTPSGAAPYEFKIHFHPVANALAKPTASPTATLKIAARIDGSDELKITAHEATWSHLAYSMPDSVTLNDIPWDLSQTNVLVNSGTNTFLPSGIDLMTAKIVGRKGRDMATMWADDGTIWVTFADNPNGGDNYELEISFGGDQLQ